MPRCLQGDPAAVGLRHLLRVPGARGVLATGRRASGGADNSERHPGGVLGRLTLLRRCVLQRCSLA